MDCTVQVVFRKRIHFRQFSRYLAHVELAGDDIGDEAGAVFLEEGDLAVGLRLITWSVSTVASL